LAPFWLDGLPVIPRGLQGVVFLVFLQTAVAGAQFVEGRVSLPKPNEIQPMAGRYQSSAQAPAQSVDASCAVVYLEGDFSKSSSRTNSVAEVEQKNISFSPGLLAIQAGTTVEFPNLDDTYHNVFSYSKTKRFDLGRYRKGEKAGLVLFDKPGVVTLHCEIHASMRGTILVLDTPYFEKTDERGSYRIGPIPPGHYLLKAWVSDNDIRVSPVNVVQNNTLHVDFAPK
jgi:plastocyanin